jgi:hypothetical protein
MMYYLYNEQKEKKLVHEDEYFVLKETGKWFDTPDCKKEEIKKAIKRKKEEKLNV